MSQDESCIQSGYASIGAECPEVSFWVTDGERARRGAGTERRLLRSLHDLSFRSDSPLEYGMLRRP